MGHITSGCGHRVASGWADFCVSKVPELEIQGCCRRSLPAMSFTLGRSPGPEVTVLSKILPLAQHSVLDGVHILRWDPVHPVVRGLRGAQLERLKGKGHQGRLSRGRVAGGRHRAHRAGWCTWGCSLIGTGGRVTHCRPEGSGSPTGSHSTPLRVDRAPALSAGGLGLGAVSLTSAQVVSRC